MDVVFATTYGTVHVYDLDTDYHPSTTDWPMYQHDAKHSGCYVKPGPDLVINDIYIDDDVIVCGATPWTWIHYTVTNAGTEDITGATRVYCTTVNVTKDGVPIYRGGYMYVPITSPFKPGDSVDYRFAVGDQCSSWGPGEYTLQVKADTIDEIEEANESNNLSPVIAFEVVD